MTADDPGPAPGGVPPEPLADIGAISATDAAFDRIGAGEQAAYDDPALRLFAGLARDIHTTPPPAEWRPAPAAEPGRPLARRAARAGRRAALAGLGAAAACVVCAIGVAAVTGVDPVSAVTNGRVRLAPVYGTPSAPGHRGGPGDPRPTPPISPTAPTTPDSPNARRTPAGHPGPDTTHDPAPGHGHASGRPHGHDGHAGHPGHPGHPGHSGRPGAEHGHGDNGRHLGRTPPANTDPGRDTPTATPTGPAVPPDSGSTRSAGPPGRTRPHTCGPACDRAGHHHRDQRKEDGPRNGRQ